MIDKFWIAISKVKKGMSTESFFVKNQNLYIFVRNREIKEEKEESLN
jgi:hypothetical protein